MATAGTACRARCKGLFYGDASQLAAQAVGTLTCIVWVFVTFFVFFKIVEALMGNRVSAEVEIEGLDIPEMGALAYPDFVLVAHGLTDAGARRGHAGTLPRSPGRVEAGPGMRRCDIVTGHVW